MMRSTLIMAVTLFVVPCTVQSAQLSERKKKEIKEASVPWVAVNEFYRQAGQTIMAGDKDELRSLFTAQPNKNFRTCALKYAGPQGDQLPLLHQAAKVHKRRVLRELFMFCTDSSIVDHGDARGNTPLIIAVRTARNPKDVSTVTRLLEAKANITLKNREEATALIVAAQAERPSANIVKQLLDARADAAARDKDGKTAGDYITQRLAEAKQLAPSAPGCFSFLSAITLEENPEGQLTAIFALLSEDLKKNK